MQQRSTPNHNKGRPDAQERTQLTAGGTPVAGEFNAGDVIGGTYQVLRWIGAGGMGNVYCVEHTIMHTEYALKTLSADKVTEVAWRRFQNEAQAIARMSHPNIVGIYNLGLHEGRLPYYVMDLLKGQSLLDLLRDHGPMEVTKALSLFVELASGFGYAHKKGIVHRDIKPPNILLLDVPEASCRVKIVDFGIAKLSGIKDPQNQYLTNAGEICGSPYYMSPEQTEGGRIDARSDIYSLGCTLFEVLTGAPPLRGRSAVDTMLMHQTTTPPTLKAASGGKEFPEMLEQVIATLLAKAPMDRYQTMELVAQDLSTVIGGNQSAVNPYATQSPRPVRSVDATDRSDRSTYAGAGLQQDLPRRRQYEAGGGEETEKDRAQFTPILIVCTLISLIILAAGGGLWWQSQLAPNTRKTTHKRFISANLFEDDSLRNMGELTGLDKPAAKKERNDSAAPRSVKDTKPFSEIRIERGTRIKVFEFPDDISIGDIGGRKERDTPARGSRRFSPDDQLEFEPDPILAKYPGYVSRFRTGDVFCLEMDGLGATDELFKQIYKLPGVVRLQISNCPNLTAKSITLIDKMPSLRRLAIGGACLSPDTWSHLGCLKALSHLEFTWQPETDLFLNLLKDSAHVYYLGLDHSVVRHHGFEQIAMVPNLVQLSLEGAKFSSADLQVLAKMPKLQAIYLSDCRVDKVMLIGLKKIKSLKQVDFSEHAADPPFSDAQVRFQLQGLNVVFKPNMAEALRSPIE